MKHKRLMIIGIGLCLVPLFFSCSSCSSRIEEGTETEETETGTEGTGTGVSTEVVTEDSPLADKAAGASAIALYEKLLAVQEKGTMFGAQMPTIHGIADGKPWYNETETGRSDTRDVAGSHPALCGWELGGLEDGGEKNLDGDKFEVIRRHMQAAHARGAFNTVTWHCGNPVIGGRYNNTSDHPIQEILEGGSCHAKFLGWLDMLADFLNSVKDADGKPVPVILRPWHEHTDSGKGTGFWWSVGNNSKSDFIALWHMTFRYLTETKDMHNLIWAYSPDLHHLCWGKPGIDQYMYMDAWPGDEYVDIMGLDAYETPWSNFRTTAKDIVGYALQLAQEKGKPFAITETGFANNSPEHDKYGHDKKWWTEQLYPLTKGRKVAYVMIWRDDSFPDESGEYPEYYGGFKGSYSLDDFLNYLAKPDILLEKDL